MMMFRWTNKQPGMQSFDIYNGQHYHRRRNALRGGGGGEGWAGIVCDQWLAPPQKKKKKKKKTPLFAQSVPAPLVTIKISMTEYHHGINSQVYHYILTQQSMRRN